MDLAKLLGAMFQFADPDIERRPTQISAFDQEYLAGGHGGVPTSRRHMPPKDHAIELKAGDNLVELLPCSSIHQIRSIAVSPGDVKLKITKESFMQSGTPAAKIYEEGDLMTCRTLFVPYRDTYTKLSIHSSGDCKIIINPASHEGKTRQEPKDVGPVTLQYKEYKIELTAEMHAKLIEHRANGWHGYIDQGIVDHGREKLIGMIEKDLKEARPNESAYLLGIDALLYLSPT